MIMNYVWAMPNRYTFKIKPISERLKQIVIDSSWIDPFCGLFSPATVKNDLNPEIPADYHLEAADFLEIIKNKSNNKYNFIFDPPYSLSRVAAIYKGIGLKFKGKENPTGGFPKVRDLISEMTEINNLVISFGWNSVGMGKKRGFEKIELLVICHGGNRNDTMMLIERKL